MARYYNEKQKVTIWYRQDGCCGDCGKKMDDYKDEYHHILNFKDGGATSIDNGVMLCYECHKNVHNNANFRQSITISHNDFRYANFSKNGESIYIQTLDEIKRNIARLKDQKYNENIFTNKKESSNNIHKVINNFKSKRLTRDDKNDLFNRINAIRDAINETFQTKIKDNYSKSYNLACEAYNKIAGLSNLKDGVNILKDYQNKNKKYMLPKKEREEIFKKFQEAWTLLKDKKTKQQELYNKETQQNFTIYMKKFTLIDNLIKKDSKFKDLREKIKQVQADMKGKKFKKEDRQKLFNFSKKLFDKMYQFQQENQKEYEHECNKNRDNIISELNTFVVVESSDFKEKRDFLKNIQAKMKGKKFKPNDRNHIFNRIKSYFDEIYKVQSVVRERKNREWLERKRIKEQKQKEWEAKQKEWKEKQARKQAEWEVKQREYKDRLRTNIARTQDSIQRLENSLWKDQDMLSDKQRKLYSVSDKWKANLRESIYKIEDRIYSKKEKLRSMSNKLSDMKSKL